MEKIVSLSLFGYGNKSEGCYEFDSFIRFFSIAMRAYRVLYFDWKIYLAIDRESYEAYKEYFDYCKENEIIHYLDVLDKKPLCRSMMWRLNPVKFADYFICRDIDTLPTYRERQAVQIWVNNGTLAHSINDNEQHCTPLMGGMVGFRRDAFWLDGVNENWFDYNVKGADQEYLRLCVYPVVKDSITEHRISGMPIRYDNNSSYSHIENVSINTDGSSNEVIRKFFTNEDLLQRSNKLIKHIGSAGFQIHSGSECEGALDFWNENGDLDFNKKIAEIESKYKNIFNWSDKN